MKTIRIPKNLHYLTDKLPQPNYGNESEHFSNYTMNYTPTRLSREKNTPSRSNSKGSLPKVSQILKGNAPKSPSLLERRNKKSRGDLLMIQGKSKII